MKPYSHRTGIAEFLGMDPEQVRVIWMDGPQLYGRTAADDAGFEAAYLASELGRPVRVQWMRHEETAWDTKGPAFAIDLRGGLDADGNVVALDYRGRIANYAHVGYNQARTVLIAQLMGFRPERPSPGGARGPDEMYYIPNRRQETRAVRFPLAFETPLRTGNLRDPNGPQTTFAGESFIDELAAAAGADPVEFRLRLLRGSTDDDEAFRRARSIAVVEAAAEAYGWYARPSPGTVGSGRVLTGRGIAYAYRARTTIAVIAEVEVDRETGRVWVRRMVCAHDCGLVINPNSLESTIQGNLLHGISRTLYEEVRFDGEKVTSVDWRTPESGSAGSAALRGGGAVASASAGGDCERDLRCDGGADEEVAVEAGAGVGGVGVGGGVVGRPNQRSEVRRHREAWRYLILMNL